MKRLVVNPDACTGCESCMLECSFQHEGAFGLDHARIQVERREVSATFRPRVCIQCEERHCIAACPVGALSIHPDTGAIRVDGDLCTGCGLCERACPHGGIHFVQGVKSPFVCDLCGGEPKCIAMCRKAQAISFAVIGGGDER